MSSNVKHSVINDLIKGNQRFLQGESIQCVKSSLTKLRLLEKKGQIPKAIILCCSDSRAPVEMIFDQDIGDLFVIRVAGNIVAPSLIGSIEFATMTFGTELIVVMGHTRCGAVQATLNEIEGISGIQSQNIQDIISRIKPHISSSYTHAHLNRDERLDKAVVDNVEASVKQIKYSSDLLQNLFKNNKIYIVGAVLDLSTGEVKFL